MTQDYYRLLEVHPEASAEVIAKAYRTLVKKYHPDTYHVSDKSLLEDKMKQLNQAFETLNDPERRARYDERLNALHTEALSAQDKVRAGRKIDLQKLGFWFLITVSIAIGARLFLRLLLSLPLLLKVLVVIALLWGIQKLFSRLKQRGVW